MANGSGTVGSANITNVAVTCTAAATYSVGGTVSGLSGTVVLQDNGGDDLSVGASGSFTFATGSGHGLGLQRDGEDQPGRARAARWRTGPARSAPRTSPTSPSPARQRPPYSVGGTVSGLSGTVVLQDNGGDDLSVSASGAFTFATGSGRRARLTTSR